MAEAMSIVEVRPVSMQHCDHCGELMNVGSVYLEIQNNNICAGCVKRAHSMLQGEKLEVWQINVNINREGPYFTNNIDDAMNLMRAFPEYAHFTIHRLTMTEKDFFDIPCTDEMWGRIESSKRNNHD